jgi:hypothetical protein
MTPPNVNRQGGDTMFRAFRWAVALALLGTSAAWAEPTRFKFEKGQALTYTILHTTRVTETLIDEKTEKPVDQEQTTRHTAVRRWKVTDVDAKGVATLEMTIVAMKWEQTLPNGERDVFDSAKPDDLNKNEMAKFIGPVVAVIRIDNTGKVIEVKESKFGSPNRLLIDLPFKIVLPATGPAPGQTWDRNFTIKLDPPQGTGETYEATQKYTAKPPVNNFLTIGLSTAIKEMPAQAADQIPLLPMLLEGDVYVQASTGLFHAARLKLKKELLNHAGEGTKYVFESVYIEDLTSAK